MTAVTITLFSLLTIQFLLIGCVIGYIVVREMFLRQMQSPYMHPEMLDEYGNVLPDEILAVRFENDYETEDNEEDDN
jgi:hypothetical protein|tara:strand:- start:1477 stop:1707 length:231 start_codon:yes stop_codon:yes gene_type:complete